MLTSHPTDARYYGSREQARNASSRGEKVIRLGSFAAGSFGIYPRLTTCGQPIGGPNQGVIVWMVTRHESK